MLPLIKSSIFVYFLATNFCMNIDVFQVVEIAQVYSGGCSFFSDSIYI